MEQVNIKDRGSGLADAFNFQSRPNHSLTRAQEGCVFWSLAVLCFGLAIGFASMGYWLTVPFAALEIALLAWAFRVLRSRECDYETLSIEGDLMVVEWHVGAQGERREMNRQWASVECACNESGRNCRLSVCSHGRATEIGRYLSDEGRLQLAALLRSRLQK